MWGAWALDVLGSAVCGVEANAQRDDASPFIAHCKEALNIIALDNWKIVVQSRLDFFPPLVQSMKDLIGVLFSHTLLKLNQWTGWQLLYGEGEAFFCAVVEQIRKERGRNPAVIPLPAPWSREGRGVGTGARAGATLWACCWRPRRRWTLSIPWSPARRPDSAAWPASSSASRKWRPSSSSSSLRGGSPKGCHSHRLDLDRQLQL